MIAALNIEVIDIPSIGKGSVCFILDPLLEYLLLNLDSQLGAAEMYLDIKHNSQQCLRFI